MAKTKTELLKENRNLKDKLRIEENQNKRWLAMRDDLLKFIESLEKELRYSYASGNVMERAKSVLRKYQEIAAERLSQTKSFRDDVITQFRAIAFTIDASLKAQTHGEKNARLRGALDVIEGMVAMLREQKFNFDSRYWNHPNIFRSEGVTKHYVDRIRYLEDQLEALNPNQQPPKPDDDDLPYQRDSQPTR